MSVQDDFQILQEWLYSLICLFCQNSPFGKIIICLFWESFPFLAKFGIKGFALTVSQRFPNDLVMTSTMFGDLVYHRFWMKSLKEEKWLFVRPLESWNVSIWKVRAICWETTLLGDANKKSSGSLMKKVWATHFFRYKHALYKHA